MSRLKITAFALPLAVACILGFQNCSGPGFDTGTQSSDLNNGTSVPAPTPAPNLPPDPTDAGRRILKVCASGCPYKLPSEAIAVSADNDILEVAAGSYNDCFAVSRTNIKLRGVNGRAHLTGKICGGKGEINITGKATVIENFEFSGMANPDTNGAGVRHQGLGLIVRNSYFHDGEDGILSEGSSPGAAEDTVLVENSLFERLGGGGGYSHGVYFGHHLQVTVRNSQFLSSRDQGHEFKCRAQNVLITCSHLASQDGVDSYSANFPEGGNVAITNSVIEQGTATSNGVIFDYGSEMSQPFRYSVLQINLTGVTVLNDRNSGTFFAVRNSNQFNIKDSVLVGGGALYSNNPAVLTNTPQLSSRANAGISAYPSLPLPSGCTKIGLSN
jgi:hypothetical protein